MHTWPLVVKLLVILKAETLFGPHEVLGNLHATPVRCLNLKNWIETFESRIPPIYSDTCR